MYALLKAGMSGKGKLTSPTLERLLKQQQVSIDIAITYYRYAAHPVNGSHPLVKLLYAFSFPLNTSADDVYARTVDISYSLAKVAEITTPVYLADPHTSIFYDNCADYLIHNPLMTYSDSLMITENNWIDLTPVTVLYQPYELKPYHLPLGGKGEEYYSVISVDVIALAVMYNGWQTMNAKRPPGERESVEHFISRYVIAGMLVSQMNSYIFNQLSINSGQDNIPKLIGRAPIHITEYNDEINSTISDHVSKLFDKRVRPSDFIANVPSITEDVSLFARIPTIQGVETQTNYSIYLLTVLPILRAVLLLTMNNPYKREMANRLKAVNRKLRSRRTLRRIPSDALSDQMESDLELVNLLLE